MTFSQLFDKFFPSFGKNNIIYYNIITVFKTILTLFDSECDKKLNRDI